MMISRKGASTMKSKLTPAVLAVSVSLAAISLTACTGESHKQEPANDAVPVVVGGVQKVQERETVSVSGTVSTPNSPAIACFLVSGKVLSVGPREGEFVRKGQILATIDPTDYRLSLDAAKAQAFQARVGLERAEDEYRRMKMLYDTKSLAPNDFEKYKAAYNSAVQLHEQAVASEKLSRKHLTDGTLCAPISGYIAKRSIEPGDTASPGRPIFEIVQMDPVEVNVGVPETDINLVKLGQKAEITLPALPGKSFVGTVRIINVSADPNTRTYMTRISVTNPQHELRVGMVAETTIRGDRTISMVTLPGDAVIRDPQGATQVYVYYPDQKRVYAKRVEIGAAVNNDVEIKGGLSGNELIVLAGQTKLRNGQVVSATEQPGRK
jgi:RND family efflux transporter MFP subunit